MNYKPKERIQKQLNIFNSLVESNYPVHTFEIDCSKLQAVGKFEFKNRKSGILGDLFTTLDKISTPCLYWFECENVEEALNAEIDLNKYRGTNPDRNIPAINSNNDSRYLYVGIRQGGKRKKDGFTHIAGRMYIHFGYYDKGTTQGLQLAYWAKSKIKLSVIELPATAKPYLNIMEKFYAISLRPVIGQHR